MEELDFELLFAKVEGHPQTGGKARRHPPTGWSSAKASSAYSRMLGDHAAFPSAGGVHGSPTGRDRFGQCNGRLAFVIDRLEARVLRAGPPPKKGSKPPAPTLHLYDLEDPVELPGEPEATEDGPSVPFRLTEAKLCHQPVGDQPYFGRLNLKVTSVTTTTVALFD
ncbi:unnamed protein product [Durusdinium trenchii]|uniref:Uncharacterized protein n=2 Tax=Durusdinium trenchii TaxID=1381693 RepID=A0ABP0P5N7_9DINO|eukprot:g13527.t1